MVLLGLGCGQEALKAVALTSGPTGTGVWPGGTKGSNTLGCGQDTGTGVLPGGTKDSSTYSTVTTASVVQHHDVLLRKLASFNLLKIIFKVEIPLSQF